MRRDYPSPSEEESGRKKRNFHLKWCVLMHSERYSLPEKMLNFPHEVVILWTLKMYFWKIVNTLLESWG